MPRTYTQYLVVVDGEIGPLESYKQKRDAIRHARRIVAGTNAPERAEVHRRNSYERPLRVYVAERGKPQGWGRPQVLGRDVHEPLEE